MNEEELKVTGIQIGDFEIFLTEEEYKNHIRERYSLEPSDTGYNPVDSPDGITPENPSGKVWKVGKNIEVPYLWTEEAN